MFSNTATIFRRTLPIMSPPNSRSHFRDFGFCLEIVSGDSNTQIKAISDHIEESMRKKGVRLYQKEGYQTLKWVLLDYVDVVVHIFDKRTREFYGVERLWADAEMNFISESA
ncbi:MAG: ribosome silencing factor [Calditrichaceae bacterium]